MKQIMILAFILMLSSAGWAQEKQQESIIIKDLVKKVEQLESESKTLNQKLSEKDKIYDDHLKDIQKERESLISFTKDNLEFLKWFVSIIALILGGIIAFVEIKSLIGFKRWKKEKEANIEKEINDSVSKILARLSESETKTIKDIIKFSSIDSELKSRIRISIISVNPLPDNSTLLRVLRSNFIPENVFNSNYTNYKKDYSSFNPDLILINNINNEFGFEKDLENPKEIEELIEDNKTKGIFYYTNSSYRFNASSIELYNFANSFATLYDNLIQLARLYFQSGKFNKRF
jgi:hypothetical protein